MLTLADLHAENLILFEAISGSHAYGLATPQSDTDIKGVFYLPRRLYYGLDYHRKSATRATTPPTTNWGGLSNCCSPATRPRWSCSPRRTTPSASACR